MNSLLQHHPLPPGSARRFPGVSLTLFGAALLVFLVPQWTGLFQFDRGSILSGQIWRILTCHWTHWNFNHLVWDVLMFFVLGTWCERICRNSFVSCILVTSALIPCVCAIAQPNIQLYRGLSGLDSALFVLLAVHLIRLNWTGDRPAAVVASIGLALFVFKALYECTNGLNVFVHSGTKFAPVPLAHIVGAAVGLGIGVTKLRSAAPRPVSSSRATHPGVRQGAHRA